MKRHRLLNLGLIGLVLGIIFLGVIEDSNAARYGRGYGSYGTYRSTANTYRATRPAPMAPRQVTPASYPRPGAASTRMGSPSSTGARAFSAPRALPKSIPATSPVARMTAFSGKVTKAGSPIITAKYGKTFSIPKQGVFSSKMSLMAGVSRTSLVNALGSGKVTVLRTKLASIAQGNYQRTQYTRYNADGTLNKTQTAAEKVREKAKGGGDGFATNSTFSKVAPATANQLQKKFKHAGDFGVTGNYSHANAKKFNQAIQNHLNSPGTKEISGTYRGNPATFHTDPNTGLTVIQNQNGSFLSGWKLNPQQLHHVLKEGKL